MSQVPIVCTLSADALPERLARLRRVVEGARVVRDTAEGVLLEFVPAAQYAPELLDLALAERTCCSFLRFILELEPQPDVLRVRIESPAGVDAVRAWWDVVEAE
jgi:hypothetical protein